jgi:lipopolysaccharide/colanic/teichoic acid biosynthesis glycosyltransferase
MEPRSEVVDQPRSAFKERRGRPSYRDVAILTILLDAGLVICTAAVVVHFVIGIPLSWLTSNTGLPYFEISSTDALSCLALFMIALFAVAGHYKLHSLHQPRSGWNEQRLSMQACLAAGLLLCGTLYLSGQEGAPRSIIALIVGATATVLGLRRGLVRLYRRRLYTRGTGRHRLLIAGENRISEALRYQVERNPNFGYDFRGFLRVPGGMSDRCCPRSDVAGDISDVENIARRSFVDEVIITEFGNPQQVIDAIEVARRFDLHLRILPGIHDPLTLHGPLSYLGNVPLVSLHRCQPPGLVRRFKAFADVVLASLALVVCLPLMSVIAGALVFEGSGDVLTRTRCVGRRTDPFLCHRFRTRNTKGSRNSSAGDRGGLRSASPDSWICRFLARTRLDGLPLLFNVLSGEMSFVGPRLMLTDESAAAQDGIHSGQVQPDRPRADRLVPDNLLPEQLQCLSALPGLTGAWRVRGLRKGSFARSLAVDAKYVSEWSLWLDATILARSFGYMLLGIGAAFGRAVPTPSRDAELES